MNKINISCINHSRAHSSIHTRSWKFRHAHCTHQHAHTHASFTWYYNPHIMHNNSYVLYAFNAYCGFLLQSDVFSMMCNMIGSINLDKPLFLQSKMVIFFHISLNKHLLWVGIGSIWMRCFQCVPTAYVFVKNSILALPLIYGFVYNCIFFIYQACNLWCNITVIRSVHASR